jgi:hypothetical protein
LPATIPEKCEAPNREISDVGFKGFPEGELGQRRPDAEQEGMNGETAERGVRREMWA